MYDFLEILSFFAYDLDAVTEYVNSLEEEK